MKTGCNFNLNNVNKKSISQCNDRVCHLKEDYDILNDCQDKVATR